MKQSFVDSLKGLTVVEATKRATAAGLEVVTVPDGVAAALATMPETVVLWESKGMVVTATPGDFCEVER